MRSIAAALALFLLPIPARADTGHDAWLRYAPLGPAAARYRDDVPAALVVAEDAAPVQRAKDEIIAGVRGMLARDLRVAAGITPSDGIVVGTLSGLQRAAPKLGLTATLAADG